MGNCASGQASDPEQISESRKIDAQIRNEKKALTKEIKILLLGAGDTGKSTLAKQMRILYDQSFTKEDRITYKKFINVNIILSMRSLLVGMGRKEMVEIHPDHAQILDSLISQSSMLDQNITPELAAGIKKLWSDQTVKTFFKDHHCQFQVLQNFQTSSLSFLFLFSDHGYCRLLL